MERNIRKVKKRFMSMKSKNALMIRSREMAVI